MSNPVEELINCGMSGIAAFLTNATCGEACWHACEDVCRCSCGGRNHGCLRRENGQRPERTAKIDGHRYKLAGVGRSEVIYPDAGKINAAAGVRCKDSYYSYSWRETDHGAPARVRKATQSQIDNWPELAAAREELAALLASPHRTPRRIWDAWPYLLWAKIGADHEVREYLARQTAVHA